MKPGFAERKADVSAGPVAAATGLRWRRPAMMEGMLAAQKRERNALLGEFSKVRGLMPLLMKPRNGDGWTPAERLELQQQLRALGHLSPYLVILVLPGSFVFLPVLAWWLDRRRHQRENDIQ